MPSPVLPTPELVALLIEAAGLAMVSGLLLPMTRAVPGHFLRYWSYAWAAVAAAVVLGLAADRVPDSFRPSFLIGHCLGEYLFGFLVWAGCREFATGEGFTARDAGLFLPLATCALALPMMFGTAQAIAPPHGALMGGILLFAFSATFRRGLRAAAPTLGLFAIRVALVGLALLFLHAAVSAGAARVWLPDFTAGTSQHLPVVRVLFVATLAFGMAVLAAERMREELEGKNRALAAATAELTSAARTDALTGLLNRRAFEELMAGDDEFAGSLAVIDLNDLKVLNDRHGHSAGDAGLRIVARALANQFRVTDPLYRTGGDEFVAVLEGSSAADLAERLGRLNAVLRGVRLPGVASPVDISVAWGVAEFAARGELPAACQHADDRMYDDKRAKKKGDGPLSRPAPALGA